jgi:putative ABC transport system permease protein
MSKDNDVIKKLAIRSFKTNLSRNIVAIVAIILTTAMFASLFTVGFSLVKTAEEGNMRKVGTSAHGMFKFISEEEFNLIKDHEFIKEYGIEVPIGELDNVALQKRVVVLEYADSNAARFNFITPLIKGHLPIKKNEIVLDTITLDMLGLGYETGQEIPLRYLTLDEVPAGEEINFTLVGVYEGDIVAKLSKALVSEDFIDENYRPTEFAGNGSIIMYLLFSNSYEIENKLETILDSTGIDLSENKIGINWAYVDSIDMDAQSIVSAILFILLIIVSGYLIIYNIFYISMVKDIHFYGLIKTIGTTSNQIRKIILFQIVILSIIGIPFGLFIGYAIGRLLMPTLLSFLTYGSFVVSSQPIIFILSAFFSFLTIVFSSFRATKVASKVSPVEAIRFAGVSNDIKAKTKKTNENMKMYQFAFANIFSRNLKKTILVVCSFTLSLVLLTTVYTMVGGFNMDDYLEDVIPSDFSVADSSYYKWNFYSSNTNSLTGELYQGMSQMQGIKSIDKIYATEIMDNPNSFFIDFYGISDGLFRHLEESTVTGEFDREKFESGKFAVVQNDPNSEKQYGIGDTISLNASGSVREYEVMCLVDDIPFYLYRGYSINYWTKVFIPANSFSQQVENASIMVSFIDVEDGFEQTFGDYLADLTKSDYMLDYRSRATFISEYKDMSSTIWIVGTVITVFLGIIGLVNFINTIVTGILSRKREFAVMQSIGMTTRQLKKLLMWEGLTYSLLTLAATFVLAPPLVYLIMQVLPVSDYYFTITPLLVCAPFLILITALVPLITYKNISRLSIIERLREI